MTVAARLSPQPWMTAPESLAVFDALASGGADARFVGGCVRDAWLGRPVKDIDIATHAPPERVIELLEAAGIRVIPTGIAHGTVTALCGGKPYEITTLRRDVENFGRHARVEFTDDWIEDAARRDLTMNALSCTPDGAMFDPFGGLADLAAGRVRFVGEARRRIEEDVLRLLRFFRFYAHYGRGEPDAEALAACRELAPRLPTLSGERVRGELFRLLTAPCAASVWRLMMGQGIMVHLLPEAMDTDRLERLIAVERDLGVTPDPTRRLAAVLDGDRPGALRAVEALRLSNHERDRLLALVEPPVAVAPSDDRKALRQALYRLGEAELFGDLLLIAAAIHDGPLDLTVLRRVMTVADDLPGLKLPIAGRDLLELGVPRGPAVGELLKRIEAWWIAADFQPSRDACLEMARGLLDQPPGRSA
ncbi:poly(A) polymerase [Azospirillum lipoferum]|uniref:CCA tRNA nucleotidyltransferase n=1 Tax=Azospirillum lipoferum TaxID=193 RepID=A0A5A9GWJ4_AZOLI|nr:MULTISPECIES: CCA tRNA nucleotidyltransferase [Azospirillum]KAA0598837.1 CCA tRNA nucleotidyltransferase [Azospirillum lipoferum]MCP1609126.1 poly(A) polymerase [Azospirillum lipoferum]MDW5535564.1 CCA tRNA nucleotidyltransferase [Azospirillum sp. NL1]